MPRCCHGRGLSTRELVAWAHADHHAAFAVGRVERRRGRSGLRSAGVVNDDRATEILDAIRQWMGQYGESPTLADWEPSRARRQGHEWRARRWEAGDWPSTRMVRLHFGTMSAAVRAAGLVPRRVPSRTRPHLRTPEDIVTAIAAWDGRYGEPPAMTDWDPARARRDGQVWRIARYYEGDWPSMATVRHHFGSLNRAIVAAGLEPRVRGERTQAGRTMVRSGEPPEARQQMLALRVRTVASAVERGDAGRLIEALNDLATAALGWADDVRSNSLRAGR